MSSPDQSPKAIVVERLKISLALLVSYNEYIPIKDVVKKHDECFNPPLKEVLDKINFKSYVELFKLFPNTFTISEDQQKIAFFRSPPPKSLIPYTHICADGIRSNLKIRARKSAIYVRKLHNNEVIVNPLEAMKFSDLAIPDRIVLNLKRMNITLPSCVQRHILPYIFGNVSCDIYPERDILIEGTKWTGRTTGVLAGVLSSIHMFKNISRKCHNGPLAVFLLQSSAYQSLSNDDDSSMLYADYFCKTLRLMSEHLNIKIGYDEIETEKDICVVTFQDIRERDIRDLASLKFFVVFNVEKIIAKVGHELFVARVSAFQPKHARSIFVMEDYIDPGPVMLRDCFKEDAIFISDKS